MIINYPNCGKFKIIQLEQCVVGGVEIMTFFIGIFLYACDMQFPTISRLLDRPNLINLTHEFLDDSIR